MVYELNWTELTITIIDYTSQIVQLAEEEPKLLVELNNLIKLGHEEMC